MAGSHETLREVTQDGVRKVAEEMVQLSQRTHEELLNNDGPSSLAEVLAALGMIRKLAGVEEEILKESGKIIFPDHEQVTTPVVEEETEIGVVAEIREKQPKTFTELLRTKIEEVLPTQESFTIDELTGRLTSKKDLERAIGGLELGDRNTFNREEASNLLERVLTTPTSPRFRPKETYGVSDLIRSFTSLRQSELDKWGKQIGWSFKEHPEVSRDEALAIRGLSALEKMMSGKTK